MTKLQNVDIQSLPANVSTGPAVHRVSPLQDSAYDRLVAGHPDCVPFHARAWLQIINDTYGHQPICFVNQVGEPNSSALPLVEVSSRITGKRGVALPFADYCPPIATDAATYRTLFDQAVSYGRERGWRFIEVRGGRKYLGELPASVAFWEHTLDLTPGADKVFAQFEGRMRNAIRKSEREGIRVEVSVSPAAVATYYALHCETRRKHGAPPQPFAFFASLHRHMISKEGGIVAIGWLRDVPVAGAVFLHHGSRAVYKFSASNEAYLSLRGNNSVLWEAIRWYANNGFSEMHFGRTSLGNEGLRKYKLGWATRESNLEYFKYDIGKQSYVTEVDKAEGVQNRLFRHLPRPLFRLAGRALYRHLA